MGLFSSVAKGLGLVPDTSGIQREIRNTATQNRELFQGAGTFAEQQLQPYMLDPSVMGELNAIATGRGSFRDNPLYRQYMDVGRESMMEDMAGSGTLYSGVRMEGMRDLGQSAFNSYMNMLTGLAGFGRQTAGQMGGIRMGTAGNVAGVNQQQTSDIANIKMAEAANIANLGSAVIGGAAKMYNPTGG